MTKRVRSEIFLSLAVLATFAWTAPVSALPGAQSMAGTSGNASARVDSARPITLAQQQRKKASPGTEAPSKYWRCGAFAKTHKCHVRWDIRSGSCVCAGR
jgi:hypothetical protein